MKIDAFIDTPFDDKEAFNDFLFVNSLAHTAVAKNLEQSGSSIDSYPISTMDDETDWLQVHAQVHQQEFSALGLVGLPDLAEIDLHDEQQYLDWMAIHAAAHDTVNAVLGL